MSRVPRQCLDCMQLTTNASRCDACQVMFVADQEARMSPEALARRQAIKAKNYNGKWRRLAADAKRRHPYCAVCGATDDLTADHIVPLALGGKNEARNIQVLCRTHNSRKGKSQPV